MAKRKKKIRVALAEKGFTGRDLSRRTGINESYLSHLLRGRMNPTVDEAAKIGQALNRDPKELFENII
ncbi:MAG: helix-turn-helix transcriptional regulator [Nitrospina sp.]|jgi:transcriptional regulator with XRE-family HTH domain|nr:helix-turn-helix transcriptional regulator [Nitrospina sp.]